MCRYASPWRSLENGLAVALEVKLVCVGVAGALQQIFFKFAQAVLWTQNQKCKTAVTKNDTGFCSVLLHFLLGKKGIFLFLQGQ